MPLAVSKDTENSSGRRRGFVAPLSLPGSCGDGVTGTGLSPKGCNYKQPQKEFSAGLDVNAEQQYHIGIISQDSSVASLKGN